MEAMKKYTFSVEFDGGTYLSQVDADNEVDAVAAWVEKFQTEAPLAARSKRLVQAVRRGLFDEKLTRVEGLTGTWCFSTLFAKKIVLGHVILTAPEHADDRLR